MVYLPAFPAQPPPPPPPHASVGQCVHAMKKSFVPRRTIRRETQAVLEEELGLSHHVLVRGVFQGQHHLNGLLESTDAQFKEELALLVRSPELELSRVSPCPIL